MKRWVGSFLLCTLPLIGCATARPVRTYVVSSEASSYSPIVHLGITVDMTADSIFVAIDSGSILAHGIARSAGAVMRDLTLEAIVARKPETQASSSKLIEPWAALATSRPLRLVDSLVFEVARGIHKLSHPLGRGQSGRGVCGAHPTRAGVSTAARELARGGR